MMKPKISVVLTTYNGSRFLNELLDSIRLQTLKPDEVIIADDRSTDVTVTKIKEYIDSYKLHNWKVYVNKTNLGWKKNFKEAISKATGDYIFLADQDDIWFEDKIEVLSNLLSAKNVWLVSSDFEPIGKEKYIKQVSMPKINYSSSNNKILYSKDYYEILRPGCVMAFSRELQKIFLELWDDSFSHDALLWIIASIVNRSYYLPRPTIYFRRTGENASNNMAHDVNEKLYNLNMIQRVDKWYLQSAFLQSDCEKIVQQNLVWCKYRSKLIKDKKLHYWIVLFRYLECYSSVKKYIGDIYYYFQRNIELG